MTMTNKLWYYYTTKKKKKISSLSFMSPIKRPCEAKRSYRAVVQTWSHVIGAAMASHTLLWWKKCHIRNMVIVLSYNVLRKTGRGTMYTTVTLTWRVGGPVLVKHTCTIVCSKLANYCSTIKLMQNYVWYNEDKEWKKTPANLGTS